MTDGIAIVTGAGSETGIGFAAARLLGERGAKIMLTSTTDRIFERVESLKRQGIEARGVVADLTNEAGIEAVFAATEHEFGVVNILVNNAGMTSVSDPEQPAAIDSITATQWATALDRNLTTAFRTTQRAVESMKRASYGRIVNVASLSGPVQAYREASYITGQLLVVDGANSINEERG